MGDPHVAALSCPNCGASLAAPAKDEAQSITCPYCSHRFMYEPAHRGQPRPSPPPPTAAASPPRPGRVVLLLCMFALPPILGVLALPPLIDHFHSAHHRILWDEVGGPPLPVNIAGHDAVCGRVRAISDGDQLSILCTDAATLKPRWRFGNLGSYGEAYRATLFAVAGDRMVVSDFHGALHVLDLQTGKQVASATITDGAEALCASGPHTVWAHVADGNNVELDVTTGKATAQAAAPPGCAEGWAPQHRAMAPPTVAGFGDDTVVRHGALAVAGGHKAPGTGYPMAVGFDPSTGEVRWTVRLGARAPASVRADSSGHDALAGDAYIATYGVGEKAWRVAAYDAKTGTPLWDVGLRVLFAVDELYGLAASPSFVYVVRTSSLDILDAHTGKKVGTIGDETYE